MDRPAPTAHSFVSQRLRLNYVQWGNRDAPPLILQHGGRDHCRSWDWAARALSRDWHVICPDLRGHGDSEWSADASYEIPAYIADFVALIDALGAEQVSIVGHSLGGGVTSRFAALYPERVRKLVNIEGLGFADSAAGGADLAYPERLRAWVGARRALTGLVPRHFATFEDACGRLHAANPRLTAEQAHHLATHAITRADKGGWRWKYDPALGKVRSLDPSYAEVTQLWQAIACPVLLLWGADSWASSPAEDGRLTHFRDARLNVYPGAGHWVHHDRLEWFLADATAFLAD